MSETLFELKKEKKNLPKLPKYPIENMKVGEYFEAEYDNEFDCYRKRQNIAASARNLKFRIATPLTIKITISKTYNEAGKELNKLKVKRIA